MDSEIVSFEEFHDCLQELRLINVLTMAYKPTLVWLKNLIQEKKSNNLSIIDVGSGGGDMLRIIASWAKKNKVQIDLNRLIGVDLNPWSKKSAELHSCALPIFYETSNIFTFDIAPNVDVMISALFTHHLDNDTLVRFIQYMDLHTNYGWFINDLHRHAFPYYFIKYATRMFSRNRLIQHDAPLSVARAFTKKDWELVLRQANIPLDSIKISWVFPFRYCISRVK